MPDISNIGEGQGKYLPSSAINTLLSAIDTGTASDPGEIDLLDQVRDAVIRRHVQRSIFPPAVFRESCWDIMLLCFVSQLEGRTQCIKQIRGQLDISNTALLRRIDELEQVGQIQRHRDDIDGRRTMVRLTPIGAAGMAQFFRRLASPQT